MTERQPPHYYDPFHEQENNTHVIHGFEIKLYQIQVALEKFQKAKREIQADSEVVRRDVEHLGQTLAEQIADFEKQLDDPPASVALQLIKMKLQDILDQVTVV